MANSASEQEIRQALAQVKHPEIAYTLLELGMLKDITVEGSKVSLTLTLPSLGIPVPVKDYLVDSIHQALAKLKVSGYVEVMLAEMGPEERTRFIIMSKE